MDFQNNAQYAMDIVLQNHYNRHYSPAYARKPYNGLQKQYSETKCNQNGATAESSLYGPETPFLAPLCEKLVSGIDFSESYLSKGTDAVGQLFEEKSFFGKVRIESVLDDMVVFADIGFVKKDWHPDNTGMFHLTIAEFSL